MAVETRTARAVKVEESSNSSPRSGSATLSASGIGRSKRSLKRDRTPSPSSTRKSERFPKQIPTPTRGKRIVEGIGRKNSLSPLRGSDRSKKQSSPSSSVSKDSTSSLGSLTINKAPRKEKSMVQLTLEAKEVSNCEVGSSKAGQRFSARAYKAFFKKQQKITAEVVSESLPTSEATAEQLNDVSDRRKHLQPGDRILAEAIPDTNNSLLKRQRNEANLDAANAIVSNNDGSISLPIAVTPHDQSQENCELDTCAGGLKRQRVNNEGEEQELHSLNGASNEDETSVFEGNSKKEACPLMTQGASEPCVHNLQDIQIVMDLEVDGGQNVCHVCKRGGKLMCCDQKGCERRYHLSCVHPPFLDVPLGVWHCPPCSRKKLEFGVQAVADEVESIWETREVEVHDLNGLLRKKQFFVKYKGLAHVHNRWVPETQLLSETPSLVADFSKKNQVKWRKEWATPHRLLGKRPMVLAARKSSDSEVLSCNHEWLVKWCGLDYEHVTWESEGTSFMNTLEVQSLMRDYEARREKATCDHSSSKNNKKVATAEGSQAKVSCLPAGPPGLDCNHLDVVNNLLDYWHKGTNAVIVDDQERIVKVISFISSLISTVSRPFLIITTPTALDSWDEEFTRFAGCIYTVVYNGNKDVRRHIRSLEFGEGDCVMFQVLITSLEVVMEDMNDLISNKWEAVIIDECQFLKIHIHSEQIKALMTDMRVLLVNCELKDSILGEHLLSLLASHSASVINEFSVTNSSPKLGSLKEKLLKYVANSWKSDCKSDSSRFVEYWVPVEISCMQLEQYCATLLSNSLFLSASSKTDNVRSLRDVLVATRKCCDHPNLMVDIPPPPPPAVDALDFGIKASGKLQLLDTMLTEIRNRGLRVLILFQSISDSARVKIGDILDDMVRQRFGENSYERVDGNVQSSRKHTALQNFNNEKQRFVFLLETRACNSSIKLTSVDVVIIFGSDWSPVNDIKNLQKITLDSQCEQMMTFRLYSCFTVEEKVLMLAREEKTRDTKLPNINRTTSHLLLKWGASYMFSKLHEFHSSDGQSPTNNSLSKLSLSKDVVDNFVRILAQNGKGNDASDSSILKVKQSHGNYICNSLFPGEKVLHFMDEEPTHLFWKNLLEGEEPQWKYLSPLSQKSRKRVHYSDDLVKIVEAECDFVKKCKKTASCSVEPNIPNPVTMEGNIGRTKEGSFGVSQPCTNQVLGSMRPACNLSDVQENDNEKCKDVGLHNSQDSLHCDLQPKIERLCEVLELPDSVKGVVESFLEYVMNNHKFSQESETMSQAFQISLCWTAASMLKYKIDHKESLVLAKEYLNFGCKKAEADNAYSMLRCLKKLFLYRIESKRLEADQLLKDNSYPQIQVEESIVTGREKAGVGATNLSHSAGADLHGELVSEVHERSNSGLLVDNAHREIDDVNVISTGEGQESVKHHGSVMPAEVSNVCLEVADVSSTVSLAEIIDKLRSYGVDSSSGTSVEQHDWVSHGVPDIAATNAADVGDLTRVINGASTNILDNHQNDGSTMQEIAAATPDHRDCCAELSGDNLPPLMTLTETCSAGDSVKKVSSYGVNQQDPTGVPNMCVEVADGSSALLSQGAADISNKHQPCDKVDSLCVVAEGVVDQPDRVVAGAHVATGATEVVLGVGDSLGQINDVASAEILDYQNDRIIGHDVAAPITTSKDDNSRETLLSNSASMNDGAIPGVSDTDTRDSVNVGNSCREYNGSNPAAGQESASSEDVIAVGQHDGVVIPPVLEAARTERMDVGNSCGENGLVSTQLDNRTVGILVQDVAASTSNIDDGSEETPLTNSTSIHQPEAAASAQVSQLILNQHPQDEAVVQPAASAGANVSETLAAAPFTSAIGARFLQSTPVYRAPLPLGHDPLQNELDRIRRESDQIVNVHEKAKLQLRSDCEKEIEEVVAQIRKKYEDRIKEKETAFVLSKSELDASHNKILMNKILAEAYRSKCIDIRACTSPGVLKDAAATFMQQFQQMASQPTQAYSGHRPSTAARPLLPPEGDYPQTANTSPSPSTTTSSRAQAAVHHSTLRPLSSSQLRPLNINSISSPATTTVTSTNHLRIDSQMRAPAPHLQGSRPTMVAPVITNISHGLQLPTQRVTIVHPSLTVVPVSHQHEAADAVEERNEVVCMSDDD